MSITPNGSNNQIPLRYEPNFIDGLQCAVINNTQIIVTVGECRDSTDSQNMILSTQVLLDTANIGVVNGSIASLIASGKYFLYLIGNSDNNSNFPTGVWLDTSQTNPTLPNTTSNGYDMFRLIDFHWTNGSAYLIPNVNFGKGRNRTKMFNFNQPTPVTTGSSTTVADVDLSGFVPVIPNIPTYLLVTHTPAAPGGKASVGLFDETIGAVQSVTGSVASQPNSGLLKVFSSLDYTVPSAPVPKVSYYNSAASGSTKIEGCGFDFFL